MKGGGRVVVIRYDWVEEGMVKKMMKRGNIEGKGKEEFFGKVESGFKLIKKKVIMGREEEIEGKGG